LKVIGVTGPIGCGKSTVAALLHDRGVAIIDADVVAREVRESDANARAAIMARFGTTDPAALARAVFGDAVALADLEAIVHPAVRDRVRDRLEALATAGTRVACVEAIKLLESPLRDRCDTVWVVTCQPEDAVQRLVERGMSADAIRRRQASQMAPEAMAEVADVVIDGSGPMATTTRQVERALRVIAGSLDPAGPDG
jgi:dephospho-CoA kinase